MKKGLWVVLLCLAWALTAHAQPDINYPPGSGGGGSGDITDVFNCSTGNCSSIEMSSGDFLNMSGATPSNTSGLKLPSSTSCSGITDEGVVCWDSINKQIKIGNGSDTTTIGGGLGDITDIFNCASGDCSNLTMGPGDFLDMSGATPSNGSGLKLPDAADCSGVTGEGVVCWDNVNKQLNIGNSTAASPIIGTKAGILSQTAATLATADSSPEVTPGDLFYVCADTTIYTDFVDADGDHSDFTKDFMIVIFAQDECGIDFSMIAGGTGSFIAQVHDVIACYYSADLDNWACMVTGSGGSGGVGQGVTLESARLAGRSFTGAVSENDGWRTCNNSGCTSSTTIYNNGLGTQTKNARSSIRILPDDGVFGIQTNENLYIERCSESSGGCYFPTRIGIGGVKDSDSACISATGDVLFADKNCDGVQDSGENDLGGDGSAGGGIAGDIVSLQAHCQDVNTTDGTTYMHFRDGADTACSGTELGTGSNFKHHSELPYDGAANSLICRVSTAPGAGQTFTATLRFEASNTDCQVVIADTDTSGIDTTCSTAYTAGDRISISHATSSGSADVSFTNCTVLMEQILP